MKQRFGMFVAVGTAVVMGVLSVAWADVVETKTTLGGGVLTLDVKSGDTLNYTQPINEVTAIVKNGDGKAYLKLGDTLSTFSGTVTVNAGIVGADTPKNWGVPSRVDVKSGASFDLALANGMTANPANLRQVPFYIAGPGASGTVGALFRGAGLGGNVCENLLQKVTLSGDAAVGSSSGRIACNNTVWDLQQHTLTVNGGIYFEGGSFSNPGHVILEKGGAYFDHGFKFNGGAANTLTFKNTAFVEHWSYSGTCNWTVNVEGSDQQHGQDYNKYSRICAAYNGTPVWTGPFSVTSGGFSFSAANNRRLDIKDTTIDTTDASCASGVRGPYIVVGSDANPDSKVFFNNVTVTQLAPNGRTSEFLDIKASNFEWTAPGATHQLQRLGVLSPNAYIHDAGTVKLAKQSYLAGANRGTAKPARLIVENTAISKPSCYLCIGQNNNNSGLLELRGTASINGDLLFANNESSGTVLLKDCAAKFMFASGQLGHTSKKSIASFVIGPNSTMTHDGDAYRLGLAGASFMEVNGGTFNSPKNSMEHILACEGYGEIYVGNGGQFKDAGTLGSTPFSVLRAYKTENFDADFTGAALTISGEGSLFDLNSQIERTIQLFSGGTTQARTFNLNLVDGGTLSVARIGRLDSRGTVNGPRFYMGFNGGVLKIARSNVFFTNVDRSKAPDEIIVYDGGAIIDTSDMVELGDTVSRFIGSLKAPSGKCIASISLPTDDAFKALYYSTPVPVRIKGGNGKCASARTVVNYDTCKIERIEVTSPGIDYDENTVVTITSPNGNSTFTCPYTLGTQAGTGGFTKRGKGMLCIYDPATYGGALRVEGGLLSGGTDGDTCVFPNDRPLEMAGGALNLGGAAYKLDVKGLSGYGQILYGRMLVKDTFTVDAADLLAGRYLEVPEGFAFASGVTFAVTGYDKLTDDQKAAFDGLQTMTVVKFASKYMGPLPTFDATPFKGGRQLKLTDDGKKLVFKDRKGLLLVFK